MTDDQRQDKESHPAQGRSPQGGQKDTNDLADIKDVQKTGMQEKARQVEQIPKGVLDDRK